MHVTALFDPNVDNSNGAILKDGMRLAIVAYRSEGLIRAEQSVRAAKRLDNVLVVDDFVEIQRVDPLGIEARQHLVDHDQQINPLLTMLIRIKCRWDLWKRRPENASRALRIT